MTTQATKTIAETIREAAATANDKGLPLAGRGHAPRCTSAYSAQLADAGVRHVYIASGGKPSRAFPLEVVRHIERVTGLRMSGKVS